MKGRGKKKKTAQEKTKARENKESRSSSSSSTTHQKKLYQIDRSLWENNDAAATAVSACDIVTMQICPGFHARFKNAE
jgi:hypothetical protein